MKKYTQVKENQALSGGLEHFTITGVNLIPTADEKIDTKDYYEQTRALEIVLEIIRVQSNIVLVSELKADGLTVGVEHKGATDHSTIQEEVRSLGSVKFGYGDTLDLTNIVISPAEYDMLGESVPAPSIDSSNTSIVENNGDVIVTVQSSSNDLYSLEVDHNAQGVLPEFTIYAEQNNVWGDPQSVSDADAAGVEATYNNGTWTLTFLSNGAALDAWKTQFGGNIKLYLAVHNTSGGSSGSMSGGESFQLEITV